MPPSGVAPRASPSNVVPSASTSNASRTSVMQPSLTHLCTYMQVYARPPNRLQLFPPAGNFCNEFVGSGGSSSLGGAVEDDRLAVQEGVADPALQRAAGVG